MIDSSDNAHRRRARIAALSTLALALFAAASAQAACTVNSPPNKQASGPKSKTKYDYYNGLLFLIQLDAPASIPIPSNPVAGQLLFSTNEVPLPYLNGGAQGQAVPVYNCPGGAMEHFVGTGGHYSGTLYRTSVRGIVYRVYYAITDQESFAAPYTANNPYPNSGALVYPINAPGPYTNVRTRIDFFASGEKIDAGIISVGSSGGRSEIPGGASISQPYKVQLKRAVTVTVPTCSVSNTNALTINLPDISTTELLAGNTKRTSTELNVTCTSASNSPPTLNITANNVINSSSAVIGNTNTGSEAASNVGLSLWYYNPGSGSFVQPALSAKLANAGVSIGSTPSNSWRFQLAAAYQKLSDAVKAGKVTGQATLTFSYS